MHDVIVYDEEYTQAASTVKSACSQMERLIRQYIAILNGVSNSAVTSGATADALKAYISYARKLDGVLDLIATTNKPVANNFVQTIDNQDQFLF